jgi:hypothetical protein
LRIIDKRFDISLRRGAGVNDMRTNSCLRVEFVQNQLAEFAIDSRWPKPEKPNCSFALYLAR